jgi:glycosyltransferase involved in cell wall biosynthesis
MLDETNTNRDLWSVSIVMATYNGEAHLEAQLQSIAAQTCMPTELIVGDDCSSDQTVSILERFAKTSPFPVRVTRNEHNLGFGDNFLMTARTARSEFIAFCDQDDIWEPHKLAAIRAAVKADPALIMVAHPSRLLRDGKLTDELDGPRTSGSFRPLTRHPLNVINGHALVFRRKLLEILPLETRPFSVHASNRRMPHDDWITFLGHALGRTIVLPEPLVRYRVHGNNVSGANIGKRGWRKYRHRGVLSSVDEVEKDYRAMSDRAAQLAAVKTNEPDIAMAAARATKYYETLSELTGRRVGMWRMSSRLRRAVRFAGLWQRGAYSGFEAGAWSRREAQKDILFGVLQVKIGRQPQQSSLTAR